MTLMTLAEAARHTRNAVLSRPDELWDQDIGHYVSGIERENCAVCVGVMLADFLCDPDDVKFHSDYFTYGFMRLADMTGITYRKLIDCLQDAGAGAYPTAGEEWPNSRESVWNKLEQMHHIGGPIYKEP